MEKFGEEVRQILAELEIGGRRRGQMIKMQLEEVLDAIEIYHSEDRQKAVAKADEGQAN